MVKTVDYDEWLMKRLRDPDEACAYIKERLDPWDDEVNETRENLAIALVNVARAYGVKLDRVDDGT